MSKKLLRILKPITFIAIAVVAAGSFIAVAGDGTCPLSGKTAKAEGSSCKDGTCPLAAKAAKAEGAECEGGTCPLAAKAECEDGVCPITGKKMAAKDGECEGGTCPLAAKAAKAEGAACEGGVCPSNSKDIVNTALEDGSFSTLLLAAQAAGIMDKLNCPQPKTVLAPTNEAFQKIPAAQWAALLQDNEKLKAVLSRHIIDGAIPAADLATDKAVCPTLGAKRCPVSGKTTIGSANIVHADIAASNGYIHAIDKVLLPEAPAVAKADATAQPEAVKVASAE